MRLVIDSLGQQAVARDLLGIGARAVDVEPAMRAILGQLRRAEVRQFDSQGAYGSGGWPELAPSTIARKQAAGLDSRILHATLRLRDSLTRAADTDELAIPRHDGLDFGTLVPYARYHVKKRPPVQLPDGERREMVRTLQRFVITGELPAGGVL